MKEKNSVHSLRMPDKLWRYAIEASEKNGVNPSTYIRQLIQADQEKRPFSVLTQEEFLLYKERTQQISSLIYEINAIGRNINQIVKNVNARFYSEQEKMQMLIWQQELVGMVKNYVKELGQDGGIKDHRAYQSSEKRLEV